MLLSHRILKRTKAGIMGPPLIHASFESMWAQDAIAVGAGHGRNGGHRSPADFDERIGPRDVVVPRAIQRVSCFSESSIDLGARHSVDVGMELEAAVVALLHGAPVGGWSASNR